MVRMMLGTKQETGPLSSTTCAPLYACSLRLCQAMFHKHH